jgi:GTP pyrophosphokinase
LFEVVGKDELSLRTIENMLRPPEPVLSQDDYVLAKKARAPNANARRARAACWSWAWDPC